MADCDYAVPGRFKAAGVFPLDDCFRPIYDEGAGYIDACPAAIDVSDNMDEGEAFTRRCSDGTILYYEDGEQSLQSVTVNLDLHQVPAEWMAQVGVVEAVMDGGEVIGWTRCTKASSNLLVAIWQEMKGGDACDPEIGDTGGWRLHLFAIKNARLTLEGGIGAEDSYMRITGNTPATAYLDSGPIPFLLDELGEPTFPENCLKVCHHTVLDVGIAPPPDECGIIDLEAPEEPCVPDTSS